MYYSFNYFRNYGITENGTMVVTIFFVFMFKYGEIFCGFVIVRELYKIPSELMC